MEKFTKSKWHVIDGGFVYALNGHGSNQFQLQVQPGFVCEEDCPWSGRLRTSADEIRANANLIAAAPVLYAELTRMIDLYESEVRSEFEGADYFEEKMAEASAARAALAKARGEGKWTTTNG